MKRFLVACAVMMLGCGTAPSTDAGLEDDAGPRDGGSRDAGHDEDAGMMADAGTDGGPLPILCDAPADGRLDPAGDRTLEIFRADVAADCEGNLAYAWAESRVATATAPCSCTALVSARCSSLGASSTSRTRSPRRTWRLLGGPHFASSTSIRSLLTGGG